MTQAAELLRMRASPGTRLIASVSAAHFVSHYHILLLPPLFDFVRAEYGVSYTELGLALVAFNVMSTVLQIPAGFLVDRLGARVVLISGIVIAALAFAVAGLVHSFWLLVAMFALAGVGNTVYHPADYALLSQHIAPERVAKAFSFHTFAGMLGSAAAPASLLLMQSHWGWRGAFVGAALMGFGVAALLIIQGEELETDNPVKLQSDQPRPTRWGLLTSPAILLNLGFFLLLALINGGLQNYSVVALTALYGTQAATANAALTGYLALTAIGVLVGGYLATRTARHGLVTALTLIATAAAAVLVGAVELHNLVLIAAMSAAGLFTGAGMPARDMIVRAVTPAGSFGTVFGFVSTGFNIGGIISPLVFGLAMDHGNPQMVFLLTAVLCVVATVAVVGARGRH